MKYIFASGILFSLASSCVPLQAVKLIQRKKIKNSIDQETKVGRRRLSIDERIGKDFYYDDLENIFYPENKDKPKVQLMKENKVEGNEDNSFICCTQNDCEASCTMLLFSLPLLMPYYISKNK